MPLLHRSIKNYIQLLKNLCMIWPILSPLCTRSAILGWRKAPAGLAGVAAAAPGQGCHPCPAREMSLEVLLVPHLGLGSPHRQGQAQPLCLFSSEEPLGCQICILPSVISVPATLQVHIPTMKCHVCELCFKHGPETEFIFISAMSSRLHKRLQGLFLSGDSPLSILGGISVYQPLWRGSTNSGSFVSTLNSSQGVLTFS